MPGKLLCSFLFSLILWAPGFGQGQKPAPKTYVLKAARLFDGKSNSVVSPGLILVSGGKIVASLFANMDFPVPGGPIKSILFTLYTIGRNIL